MVQRSSPKYRFPWRPGNEFRLHKDGDRFYPAMLNAIRHAQRYILLEIYLVESGAVVSRFVDALTTAAESGISVYMLLDAHGARGLARADQQRLHASGVNLIFYNPLRFLQLRRYLFRDHRKILVADGEVVFVGGAGISDNFDPGARPNRYWRETMVEVRGENTADWVKAFKSTWNRNSERALHYLPSPHMKPTGHQRGRVTLSPVRGVREIRRALINRVRQARVRVWLATAYFVPSRKIRRALRRAAKRGVDVRLLLPGSHIDHPSVRLAGRRFYTRLLHNGVRVFEYEPRFLHHKVILCDDWTSIGSSNVDRWNLRWNLEANQEIDDPSFAKDVEKMFMQDFSECLEIDYESWPQRTRYGRLLEWFWGVIDRRLARLGIGQDHHHNSSD